MKSLYNVFSAAVSMFLFSCNDDAVYFDERDAYVGDYKVDDYCDTGISDYELTVLKSDYDHDEIYFSFPGLFEAGLEVHAIVTGMKVVVPLQQFYISSYPEIFYEFSGSGSLNDSIFTIDYQVLTVENGLIMDDIDCQAVLKRF